MKIFTYSEARQNLSELLTMAQSEEIEIRRRDGAIFTLKEKKKRNASPFDVAGVKTNATTQNILDAVREARKD